MNGFVFHFAREDCDFVCRPSLVVCVFHCRFAYFRIVLARKAPQTERISYKILFRKHSEVQCLRALCKRNGSVTHLCPTCCCRDRVFTALDSLYAVWSSLLAVACGGVESVFACAMCVHPGARALFLLLIDFRRQEGPREAPLPPPAAVEAEPISAGF